MQVSGYVHVTASVLPAQVHSGEQSESMPLASAGREASVLELADLDREVTSSLLTLQKLLRPLPPLDDVWTSCRTASIWQRPPCMITLHMCSVMPHTHGSLDGPSADTSEWLPS